MGKLHFGYKRHTVTDENGLALAEETTAVNESDMKHLETPLKKTKLPRKALVYADKGYGAGIARYVGLSKTHAQHIMESIAYNLYRTPGIIVSNSIR